MTDYSIRLLVEGRDVGATAVLKNVGSGFGDISKIAAGFLGANIVSGIARQFVELGKAGLDSYRYYERLDLSLQSLAARELRNKDATLSMATAMDQSSGRAKELLHWVEQLAIKSPFDQAGVADAFRMQLAYGYTTEAAQKLTEVMIDWAAGSGRTTESMGRVSLALGQIFAQGKLAGQEVRQLTEAGIAVDQILAKAFNVTTAEVVDMRKKGLIPANDAIQAIVDSLDRDFGGAAIRQSGTMEGLINSMEDIKSIGLREFFTGTFEAVQPKLQEFVDKFQEPGMREAIRGWGAELGDFAMKGVNFFEQVLTKAQDLVTWWNSLDGGTQRLISSLGILVAVGPTLVSVIGAIVTAIGTIGTAITGIQVGMAAWNAGMTITTALGAAGLAPMAITIGAITLAVGAVVAVWATWNAEITQTNKEGVKAVDKTWVDFFNKQKAAGADATKMLNEYKSAQQRVNDELAKAGPLLGLFIDKQGIVGAGFNELNVAMQQNTTSYQEYVSLMVDAGLATGKLSDDQGLLTGNYIQNATAMQMLTDQLGIMTEAQYTSAQVAATAAEKYKDVEDGGMLTALQMGAQNVDGLTNSLGLAEQAAANAAAEEERLADAARKAAFAHYDLTTSMMGAGLAATNKAMLDQYRQTLEGLELPPEVIAKNMQDMGLEMGVIDQRSISLSTGLEQMNAALASGQIPISSAKEAWAMYYNTVQKGNPDFDAVLAKFGSMPTSATTATGAVNNITGGLQTLNTQAGTTKSGLETMTQATNKNLTDLSTKIVPVATQKMSSDFGGLDKVLQDVGHRIGSIQEAANNLYNWGQTHTIVIDVVVHQSGSIPTVTATTKTNDNPDTNAFGGNVYAGVPTYVGEKGRELFIPSVDGRIVSARDVDQMLEGRKDEVKTLNFYIYDAQNPIDVAEEIRRMEFFYA